MSDLASARATWLGSLVVDALLPERTVLVRSEAVAHSWRRDLATLSRADLLLGTRFATPLAAAVALLESVGVTFLLGEETVRAARVASLLQEDLPLQGFDLGVLRKRPGWEKALAATLTELEASCIDLDRLRSASDRRCSDLALLLERLDVLAAESWTSGRAIREATALLRHDPKLWPFGGSTLAEASGHETAAVAEWLQAVPRMTLVSPSPQPRRKAYVDRVTALFSNLKLMELGNAQRTERDLLAQFLFSPPSLLTDRSRARSNGPDGTVQIELHSGIDEELDAAVAWVISEVGDHATPFEQIAIVVPLLDPYAGILAGRLGSLGENVVYVVGGLPAIETSARARVATALRALEGYLHIDVLADVVPILKLTSPDIQLSRRDAIAALYELGTAGGSQAHREGALTWAERNPKRQTALATAIAEASKDEDAERVLRDLSRALDHLKAMGPALEALDRVARILIANGSLDELWQAARELLREHVRVGVESTRILFALDQALAPLIEANVVFGESALTAIGSALQSIRLQESRFGDARVTVVALADAPALSFRAVRVVGLAEGMVPSNVRDDPALPDSLRSALGPELPLAENRALAQLHALHQIVSGTSDRIVLSASRMDSEGRYREPSGILLEAAAAIGRPPLGRSKGAIPDAKLMRKTSLEPARQEMAAIRSRWTILDRGVLDRAARSRAIPARWRTDELFQLSRIARIPAAGGPGVMDGWFPDGAFADLPGLSTERPISASALSRLLECPHRFLFERVLGWQAPPELVDEGSIDPLSYGSLFHETAETFYRAYGSDFCAHAQTLDAWKQAADEISRERFERFLETYPLVGDVVRDAQRARLRRDLHALLEADWQDQKTFVDVERAFGPMPLKVGAQIVHVRGYIDRLDTIGTMTSVRDLKTGRAKPRKKDDELLPSYDVQLGLYGLVTRAKAAEWKIPEAVQGAYVYPADPSGDERAFETDFAMLATETERWVQTGIDLLQTRRFPRTPNLDDCRFCPFKPVCGNAAAERANELLSNSTGAIAAFAVVKLGGDSDA